MEKGYPRVGAIKGGLTAWREAGGKTAATKK
jgi:rhodanese-related sulfurtransferase